MSAGTSEFFCLICLLLCSCIALEIIIAERGQDVILPCKAPNINILVTAVEWSRSDQDPEYVLFYRDGRLYSDVQHPSYQNRVDLQDKEMKNGDVSLILKNVTMEDTGRYECRVFEIKKNELISNISLEIHPPENKNGNTRDGGNKTGVIVGSVVGVILLLAVLGSVGFLIYRRHTRKIPKISVPAEDEIPTILML